jgi:hypothetical protein
MIFSQGERTPKQAYRSFHVFFGTKKYADPAGFGKDVVRFGFFSGDDLVPNGLREWNIDQMIAVDVPQFSPSQPELHATEAMGCHRDPFPPGHEISDTLLCATDWHDARPPSLRWIAMDGKRFIENAGSCTARCKIRNLAVLNCPCPALTLPVP